LLLRIDIWSATCGLREKPRTIPGWRLGFKFNLRMVEEVQLGPSGCDRPSFQV
jgi:hypothetical protein